MSASLTSILGRGTYFIKVLALLAILLISLLVAMQANASEGLPDNWLWQPLAGQGGLKALSLPGYAASESRNDSEKGTRLSLGAGETREIAVPPDMRSAYLRLSSLGGQPFQGLVVRARYRSGFELQLNALNTEDGVLMLPLAEGMTHWLLDNQNDREMTLIGSSIMPMSQVDIDSKQAVFAGLAPEPRWYQRHYRQDHKRFVQLAEGDRLQMAFAEPGDYLIEIRSIHNDTSQVQWDGRGAAIALHWNGKAWRDWQLYPVVDHLDYWQHHAQRYLTSFPMRAQLAVPRGQHTLSFEAVAPMLVRIISVREAEGALLSGFDQGTEKTGMPLLTPDYDESLFSSSTESMLEHALYLDQLPDTLQNARLKKSISIIKNKFLYWRDYPLAAQDQIKKLRFAMRPVKYPEWHPYFIAPGSEGEGISRATFYQILPGQSVQVTKLLADEEDGEGFQSESIDELRISVPYSTQHQQWLWRDAEGEQRSLNWHPPSSHQPRLMNPEAGVLEVASVVVPSAGAFSELVNRSDQVQWIALEYRSATRHSLDQSSWLELRERLGGEKVLALLQQRTPPLREVERTLWYAWLPLIKWIDSSRYGWLSGVDTTENERVYASEATVQQWIASLESAGEYAMLIRMLKGVLANPGPVEAWRTAYQWLHHYYQRHDQQEALDGLYILAMERALHPQGGLSEQEQTIHLSNLALQALKNNLPLMAARLYRILDEQISSPSYLTALVSANLLEASLDQPLSPDLRRRLGLPKNLSDRAFLERLQALREGERQGLNQLFTDVPETDSLQQWLSWMDRFSNAQPELPSLSLTMEPKLSAGSATILQLRRNLSFDREQVAPGKPAIYELAGPANLRLDLRLIHAQPDSELHDWIRIQIGTGKAQSTAYKPIVASQVSSHLQLLDDEGHVGSSTGVNLRLGPGRHRIAIEATKHPGLVRLSAQVPGLLIDLARQLYVPHAERLSVIKALNNTRQNGLSPSCLSVSGLTRCVPVDSNLFTDDLVIGDNARAFKTLPREMTGQPGLGEDASLLERAMQALWQWDSLDMKQRQQRLASLKHDSLLSGSHEQKHHAELDDPELRTLLLQLSKGFGWELEDSPAYSPGRVRQLNPLDHGSPFMAKREVLMGVRPQANTRRLRPHQAVTFVTRFENDKTIYLELESKHLPYRPSLPTQVQVAINDQTHAFWDIREDQENLSIKVPAGEQQIRLAIRNPFSEQWLYVRGYFVENGRRKDLIGDHTRFYEVSEQDDPLRYYFDQPTLLRIDELRNDPAADKGPGGSTLHYHYALAPSGDFVLPPSASGRSLYRVYSWKLRESDPELKPFPYQSLTPFFPVSDPELRRTAFAADLDERDAPGWRSHPRLAGPVNHTHGVYAETRQRFDDETADGGEEERWLELGWRYRQKRSCDNCYTRADFFARQHLDQDNTLFGAKLWLDGRLNRAWTWTGYQQVLMQSSPKLEGAWYGTATVRSQHKIDETQAHRHELGLFARYLTADESSGDDDIFTRYKSDHRFGYRLAEIYQWRPNAQHLLQGRVSLLGNENLTPDQLGARATWHGQWLPWQAGAHVGYQYFLDDKDRNDQGDATRVGVSLAHLWAQPSGRLWRVDMDLSHALEAGNWSLGLSLSLDWHRGRALRDIRPAEEAFYGASHQWLRSRTHHHAMQYETTTP